MTLKARKKQLEQSRQARTALTNLIKEIAVECELDMDSISKRLSSALKSEYGAVNGLINLLTAICAWPAEQGDGSSVAINQDKIATKFNIDLVFMDDIKSVRGYHTFISNEGDLIDGKAPDYEEYTQLCQILLGELKLSECIKTRISQETWELTEEKTASKMSDEWEHRQEQAQELEDKISAQLSGGIQQ